MKKLTITFVFMVVSAMAFTQTIVDTLQHNRNAILEEFTGIHCTYCPDGHRIANNIQAAHPGRFWAINIHTGGYANPSTGEPDFRTSFGAAIAGQSGLTGYPAGTINRHLFSGWSQGSGTAMSRGHWDQATTQILGQASYVNLAATASIDLSTRVMTVLVEGYFTDSVAPSSMKLNVAVLQNNVQGPQVGMSSNPSQVLPNGKYNHMHMLRHLITGQWGVDIDTTAKGTFFSRTFTYNVPSNINNVPMNLGDLEVIAFIVEGQQEIETGTKAVMNYVTPPGVSLVDLEIKDESAVPSSLCATSFTPKVQIKNLSNTVNADTFSVKYTYNNGTPVVQMITTALNAGDSVTVTFPAVTLSGKEHRFAYTVDVDTVMHLIDMNVNNSMTSSPLFYTMPASTMGTVHNEDFESYSLGSYNVDHTVIENPSNSRAFVVDQGISSSVTWDLGGYGASSKSYRFDFYSIKAGKVVNMMFEKLDFSNTGHGVKFNYAYAQYTSENDQLAIKVSDDCGATWTTVWSKAGSQLMTHPASTSRFYPQASDWAKADIDLSAFDGKSEVIVAFVATSDYGNDLYIDDIQIYDQTNAGIETAEKLTDVNLYPNPADNEVNIDFTLRKNAEVSYRIVNNMGQVVLTAEPESLSAGNHLERIDISSLAAGLYMLNLNIDGKIVTKKISIK